MNRNDQNFLVQKIRTQYTEKQHTQLDALKALDAKVKRPVYVFSYLFGSISAIVMGCGMSLVMTDIGTTLGMTNTMVPGIIVGVVGMIMAIVNYPIYKGLLYTRKKEYADQIMQLASSTRRLSNMKKTRILSILTAAMIMVSSVATYAVWDTVTVESRENTVTMRNPVTVSDSTSEQSISADAGTLDPASVTASGTVKFTVENTDDIAKKLTLQESIEASEKLLESTDYSIVFSGDGVVGKTDSSVTNGQEEYNYTITFTESGLSKLKTNANACKIKVTATLS